ncbi:hypothetical protein H4582DRAFT_1127146 [Lactarius indigo]|nr:hypothetical protein H4582DRAFT_1127146 [Lactarius indigo]
MERSAGNRKSVYGMLMTVLFYTTGFICALRTAAWLTIHMLIPAISHIIALYYHPSPPSNPAPPSPTSGGAGSVSNAGAGTDDVAGLLFKLVHTAAGHDLLVPVSSSMYQINGAAAESTPLRRALVRLAFISSLIGTGGVAAYCYLRGPSALTWARRISATLRRQRHGRPSSCELGTTAATESPTRCSKTTKLNPAAPAFTPSSPSPSTSPAPVPPATSPPQLHRLDPTARTFAPRGCATPPSPADSTDSAGPATPSPSCMPSAFALAAARVARAAGAGMGKSGGGGGGGGVNAGGRVPVGVGKMRVVRPEEVVAGERRAGEVFVFF